MNEAVSQNAAIAGETTQAYKQLSGLSVQMQTVPEKIKIDLFIQYVRLYFIYISTG